jgi:hypothetical protein
MVGYGSVWVYACLSLYGRGGGSYVVTRNEPDIHAHIVPPKPQVHVFTVILLLG